MFFYFCKVLFSDFLQFNGNFVDAQNNSVYRDWAPLIWWKTCVSSLLACGLGITSALTPSTQLTRQKIFSASLQIFVSLWFVTISLAFFYLSNPLFSGFPEFKITQNDVT